MSRIPAELPVDNSQRNSEAGLANGESCYAAWGLGRVKSTLASGIVGVWLCLASTVREHGFGLGAPTSVMGWWIQCDWIMNAPSDAGAKQRYSLHFALSSGAFAFRASLAYGPVPARLEATNSARSRGRHLNGATQFAPSTCQCRGQQSVGS
ncbi:hypothetical protein GCM10029976_067040 [Kribbella albertanoniae]